MQWFDYPEFVRLRRAKLRGKSLLALALGTFVILGGILFCMYLAAMDSRGATTKEMLKAYYITCLVLLTLVNGLYGLSLSSQSIVQEREQNTYDFQRLAAAGPWRLALGKLLGAPCEAWFVLICATPFLMIPVVCGVIPGSALLLSLVGFVAIYLYLSGLGLACSALSAKSSQSLGLALLLGGMIYWLAAALARWDGQSVFTAFQPWFYGCSVVDESTYRLGFTKSFSFFGLDSLPPVLGFVGLNLLLTAFFVVITARRLSDEELPMLSVRQAVVVFLISEFLLAGSLPDRLAPGWVPCFHGANLALLSALAFLMMPTGEQLRSRVYRGRRDDHWRILFEKPHILEDSPPFLALGGLCLAYVLLGGLLAVLFDTPMHLAERAVLMVAAFGVAVCGLLTVTQLYFNKAGLRVGFLVIALALVLPPIALACMGTERYIPRINPVAYLVEQFQMLQRYSAIPSSTVYMPQRYGVPVPVQVWDVQTWACPAICVVLAILLSVLAGMRLRFLLDMRESERGKEASAPEGAAQVEVGPS